MNYINFYRILLVLSMGWPWLLCLAGQTWNSQRLCRRLGKGFGRTGLPPMRRFQTIAGSHSEEEFVCFLDADSEQIEKEEDMAEELARAREEKDFDLVWADKGAATVSRAGSCTWIKLHTDCIKMLWINWTQSSIFLCWFGIFYTQLKNMLTPWLTNMRIWNHLLVQRQHRASHHQHCSPRNWRFWLVTNQPVMKIMMMVMKTIEFP